MVMVTAGAVTFIVTGPDQEMLVVIKYNISGPYNESPCVFCLVTISLRFKLY